MTSLLTPTPARSIDPRGQRFGAGLSAIVLAVAFLLNVPWLAVLVGINLGVSSFFGTRFFLPGRPWKAVKRTLKLGPTEMEHEYPPRSSHELVRPRGPFVRARARRPRTETCPRPGRHAPRLRATAASRYATRWIAGTSSGASPSVRRNNRANSDGTYQRRK